jgi:hypothetical protein
MTVSGPGYYPQIDATEWKAGSIRTSNYFESVDNVGFGTSGTTATITTSGPTVNPNDLILAFTDTCGGDVPQAVGAGYTGLLENTPEPGHIAEAMAATATGTYSATSTWSTSAPAGCLGGTGNNDSWFGIIVPLVAASQPSGSASGITFSGNQ